MKYRIETLSLAAGLLSLTAACGGSEAPTSGPVTVEGYLTQGTECAIIQTTTGATYSVTGNDPAIRSGTTVRLSGRLAEMSFCQQGSGTISATSVTPIELP